VCWFHICEEGQNEEEGIGREWKGGRWCMGGV